MFDVDDILNELDNPHIRLFLSNIPIKLVNTNISP